VSVDRFADGRIDAFARASLRTRLLVVIFAGSILPLAILGLWLTLSARNSGEVLLASRLDQSLQRIAQQLGPRWVAMRSEMISLSESPKLRQALKSEAESVTRDSTLVIVVNQAGGPAQEWIVRSSGRGELRAERASPPQGATLLARMPIRDDESGMTLGTLVAALPAAGMIPAAAGGVADIGSIVGAFDRETRASLLPLPFDPRLMATGRFDWEREHWLARFRVLDEPAMVIALAAPLTPYTQPFSEAARKGAIALLLVAVTSLAVVVLLTRRMTQSLAELSIAARSVAEGNLDRRVEPRGSDEVSALARAFNTMTQNLRSTLDQLARQEGLASVGEFAASLAHEVRNPLTAIRVELQSLEEEDVPASVRDGLERSLRHIHRLEATVTGSLRVARGGRAALEPVALAEPLGNAWRSARSEFDARGAALQELGDEVSGIRVRGDAAALEQLFLNLLLNAAQALGPGGEAHGDVTTFDGTVEVAISDNGTGFDAAALGSVFEPLRSTRRDGTGLGLTIAQRIAQAHAGDIRIESAPGQGTTVRVTLPRIVGARDV